MTTESTYNNIPTLRFPDFANDGEWEDYSIEEVFDIRNGYTPSKSKAEYWENGTIPWFRMEDIRANGNILSDSIQHITPEAIKGFGLFPAYSIIVATSATIGEHALITVESLANQRFTYLSKRKPFENKVDMLYFHYYMFVIDEWCKKNTNTGGFLSVNMSAFRQLRIPIPPLAEQQRIAACLSAADEMIASTNVKLEQLKAYKKGLMQNLFNQRGGVINNINNCIVIRLRFPEFYNEKEWEEKKLGEIANTFSGGTPPAGNKNYYGGSIPFIRSGELNSSCTELFLTQEGLNNSSAKIVERGTILYALYGATSGEVGIAQMRGAINQAILALIPKEDYNSLFIYYYLKSQKDSIVNQYIQGGQGNLSGTIINALNIPVPALDEQRKIASCLSTMDNQINAYTEKVVLLGQYKKGLMQRMFPQNQMN